MKYQRKYLVFVGIIFFLQLLYSCVVWAEEVTSINKATESNVEYPVPPYSSDVIIFPDPFFGGKVTDFSSVTAEFHRPVVGVKAEDLTVNGLSATNVVHEEKSTGDDKYSFTGFPLPPLGTVEIILHSEDIKYAATQKPFGGFRTVRYLFDSQADDDKDSLSNDLELQSHCDPIKVDTDNDGLPDAYEVQHTSCLSCFNNEALPQDNYGVITPGTEDSDGDGITNRQEWKNGTDPCRSDK